MDRRSRKMRLLESILLKSKTITIIAVISSLFGSIALFFIAMLDIIIVIKVCIKYFFYNSEILNFQKLIISDLIGAIDIFLLAIVLIIFSFGVYELFISKIKDNLNVLEIRSLDELKDKLAKVIIMVLIVSFFQKALEINFDTPQELLYFSSSILLLSISLYLLKTKKRLQL